MKIVVLDGCTENPGDLSWDGLRELGDLTVYDRTSVDDEAEIIRRIGDAEAEYGTKMRRDAPKGVPAHFRAIPGKDAPTIMCRRHISRNTVRAY